MKKSKVQVASLIAVIAFLAGITAMAPAALASKGQVLLTDINGTPKQYWRVGETMFITVIDPDENRDSDEVEFLKGSLQTQLGDDVPVIQVCAGPCPDYPGMQSGDFVSSLDGLILQETGVNTGVFRSQTGILITKALLNQPVNTGDLQLQVFDTDTVFVRYQDPTNPNDISIYLGKIYTGTAPGTRTRAIIAITDAGGNPVSVTDIGRTIFVTVTDADENTSPTTVETVKATLVNARTKQALELTLVETGPDTGVFRNVDGIILVDFKNKGRTLGATEFEALDKDTILAFYQAPAGVVPVTQPPAETRTDTSPANPLVSCSRVVPVRLAPGAEATIKVTCTAKVALRALLISEKLDPSFTLVSGDLRGAGLNLAAGGKVELTYTIRAGAAPGTFSITGDITPATEVGPQPTISFPSAITVAASSSSAFAELKVTTVESPLVTVSRDVPDTAAAEREFTVKVKVTAKQALRALLINDTVPAGCSLAGGTVSRAGTITPLNPGQSFEHQYKLICGQGSFTITGVVTPVTSAGAQAPVTVTSTFTVGAVAVAMLGMGDINDPHDFAVAQVKVAHRNPARISFIDATGREITELRIGDDVFVQVEDRDQNADSDRVERVVVMIFDVNGGQELEVLVETGVNTGVFRNTGPLKIVPKAVASCPSPDDLTVFKMGPEVVFTPTVDEQNDGQLAVARDDVIYATYFDDEVAIIESIDEIKRALDAFDVIAITATIKPYAFDQFDKKLKFVNDAGQPISEYKVGMDTFVQLEDPTLNYSSNLVEQVPVIVLDRNTGDRECVTLQETGPGTGIFRNQQGLPLRRGLPSDIRRGDGILQMQDRDNIEAHFQAADNPQDYAATSIGIIPLFEPPVAPTKPTVRFDPASIEIGKSFVIEVVDPNRSGVLTDAVTLTQLRGGTVVKTWKITVRQADGGVFRSEPIQTGELGSGATVEAQDGDTLRAEYAGADPATATLFTARFEVREFKASPMPATTRVTFQAVGTGIERVSVSVYDLSGKLVFSGSRAGSSLDWTLSGQSNGVYLFLMTASGRGQTKTSKVMKLVILR
ncbi:MAG: T9SS type A sorting domain-containing protein [Candidatus Bipolaricaulota bacterium]|nr:T9SS type A sorting domain-containing protein [Candidatus Bipolaricaulota bacterium]MDW8030890.1 T9SS type A sorting domain-containing protein [Candidatus Bipolaricaulota bacterium]